MGTTVINLDKICRVCMNEDSNMRSIFDSDYNISRLLEMCSSIEISHDDGLPEKICSLCFHNVNIANLFRTQCEKSDVVLRQYLVDLNENKNQNEENVKKELEYTDFPELIASVVSEFNEKIKSKSSLDLTETDFTQIDQYSCTKCCAILENTVDLNTHLDLHSDTTNICYICNCGFKNEISLNEHKEFNHNQELPTKDYKLELNNIIEYCDVDFDNSTVKHENKIKSATDSGAKKKRGRPKKIDGISTNSKKEDDINHKYKCKHCDESFTRKMYLKRHILTDHADDDNDAEKIFECDENDCKKSYSTYELLLLHMKGHSSKVYDCKICSKKFPRLDIYVEHKKRHSNERSYLCTKCGKGYFNQIYLDKHMLTHLNDHLEKPTYECNICGKKLKHSNHLQVHMRTHLDRTQPMSTQSPNPNKKLILCSVCGRSCSSSSNLAVHMRRHSGKMTSFCKICGKGYPRTTDLTLHMRQHTGEKPFVCTVCNRGFARSDKLAIHMRTHSGEKPYICSVCGRAFAQSNDLASHKRRNLCGQQQTTSTNNTFTVASTTNNHHNSHKTNGLHYLTTLSVDAINNLLSETQNNNTQKVFVHPTNVSFCGQNFNQSKTSILQTRLTEETRTSES